ncbi:acyl-CoA dehydrogenase family protein [Arthrobacter psychrolactophilus]
MPLSITEEHADLAASVTEFAERFAGLLDTREQLDSYQAGGRPSHWSELVDNGLHSLHISEERGGQGGTVADTAIVVEEFGRRLVPGPYVATVLASAAVASAAECKASLRGLDLFAEGATGALVTAAAGITATATADGWRLSGRASVASLISAEHLVVAFEADSVIRFALLDIDTAGLERIAEPCTDLTRDAGTLVLNDVAIDAAAVLEGLDSTRVDTLQAGLLAAEAAGVMRWAVDATVEYSKMREQFGTPIGSFQAIKHKCANLLIASELATAAASLALVSLEQDSVQQTLAAGSAIEVAILPSVEAITESITIFGGIGFTWEHDAHLFWRRAITLVAQISPQSRQATDLGRIALDQDRLIDIELQDEDPAFRERIAALLDEATDLVNEHDGGRWSSRGSQRTFLAENGLAAPHWSAPYGLGASPSEQIVISQEYARRGLIQPSSIIGEWAMPTILAYGSDAIKEQFAMPTLRGELIWCQLFSEPGAGSDLAGLSTRAIKVDGGWELKGQKV